jgi:hypothetical protein
MPAAWYAFRAYNTQTLYGYGTAEEADAREDILNEGRSVGLYSAHRLTDAEAAELGFVGNDEAANLSDVFAEHANLR